MWVKADLVVPSCVDTVLADLNTSRNRPPSGCSMRSMGFMEFGVVEFCNAEISGDRKTSAGCDKSVAYFYTFLHTTYLGLPVYSPL